MRLVGGLLHSAFPTGRLAWQWIQRMHAHVGLVSALGTKQNQLGLDQCSLHMQPRDLRMQPVSPRTKVGASCNAGARRLRVGFHGDGEGEDKDRDEQNAKHCTNSKPSRTCVARPGSKPAPRTIHGACKTRAIHSMDAIPWKKGACYSSQERCRTRCAAASARWARRDCTLGAARGGFPPGHRNKGGVCQRLYIYICCLSDIIVVFQNLFVAENESVTRYQHCSKHTFAQD